MPGIIIPREAFRHTALGYPHERVGAGVDFVISRELLQNSRDAAGSTCVETDARLAEPRKTQHE